MLDAFSESQREHELRQIAENGGCWPAPDVAGAADGHGLSAEQARWLVERLVDHPGRTVSEPLVLNRPWRSSEQPTSRARSGSRMTSRRCARSRLGPSVSRRRATGQWCRPPNGLSYFSTRSSSNMAEPKVISPLFSQARRRRILRSRVSRRAAFAQSDVSRRTYSPSSSPTTAKPHFSRTRMEPTLCLATAAWRGRRTST